VKAVRRRDFIKGIAGSATIWPLAVRAQQTDRVPLIGVAMTLSSDDPESQARLTAFRQALQDVHIWKAVTDKEISISLSVIARITPPSICCCLIHGLYSSF
jgi:hypothetical protein